MDSDETVKQLTTNSAESEAESAADSLPDWTDELLERIQEAPPPPWAGELLDSVAKLTRGQGRLGLRVEEVERKLEGGLADLRGMLERETAGSAGAKDPAAGWEDILDALDLLSEVKQQQVLPQSCDAGLAGVVGRLDRALARAGIARHGELGQPVDALQFRVVGTADHAEWPEGVVIRLVRHAATRGNQLVREGEVLINRRAS